MYCKVKYNIRVLKANNFVDIEIASKFLNKRIFVGDNFETFDCNVMFLKEIKINAINECFIDHNGDD